MKRYVFDCKGCTCECKIFVKDTTAVPHLCPSRGFQPDWQRTGEFEQYEEAPSEIEALKVHNERLRDKCRCLAENNEELSKTVEYQKKRYSNLVDWIIAFLGLGAQGIKSITGREVDK